MSALNGREHEITALLDAGHSQAEIIRQLAGKGVKIARSTLSDFVRQRQDAQADVATMDDDGLPERFAAALDFQRATADELTDRLIDVVGEVQRLQREEEQRHTALMEALSTLEKTPTTSSPDEVERLLQAAVSRLDDLAARTGGAGLRWIWSKAILITGVVWGVIMTCAYYLPIIWLTLLMD